LPGLGFELSIKIQREGGIAVNQRFDLRRMYAARAPSKMIRVGRMKRRRAGISRIATFLSMNPSGLIVRSLS